MGNELTHCPNSQKTRVLREPFKFNKELHSKPQSINAKGGNKYNKNKTMNTEIDLLLNEWNMFKNPILKDKPSGIAKSIISRIAAAPDKEIVSNK